MPVSRDALSGSFVAIDRARVEARVGESDAAVAHIEELLAIPGAISPALLRIDPNWAPLRGDARFRKPGCKPDTARSFGAPKSYRMNFWMPARRCGARAVREPPESCSR